MKLVKYLGLTLEQKQALLERLKEIRLHKFTLDSELECMNCGGTHKILSCPECLEDQNFAPDSKARDICLKLYHKGSQKWEVDFNDVIPDENLQTLIWYIFNRAPGITFAEYKFLIAKFQVNVSELSRFVDKNLAYDGTMVIHKSNLEVSTVVACIDRFGKVSSLQL